MSAAAERAARSLGYPGAPQRPLGFPEMRLLLGQRLPPSPAPPPNPHTPSHLGVAAAEGRAAVACLGRKPCEAAVFWEPILGKHPLRAA